MRSLPDISAERWQRAIAAIGAPPEAASGIGRALLSVVHTQWLRPDMRSLTVERRHGERLLAKLERALDDIEEVRKASALFGMATDPLNVTEARRRLPALRKAVLRDADAAHASLSAGYWKDLAGIFESTGRQIGTGSTGPFQRFVSECHAIIGLDPPSPDSLRDFLRRRRRGGNSTAARKVHPDILE